MKISKPRRHSPKISALCAGLAPVAPAANAKDAEPTPEQAGAVANVQRFHWVTELKPDRAGKYIKLHEETWPGVKKMIKECHVRNYSIAVKEIVGRLFLFSYIEYTGDDFEADMKQMAADPETQRWWKETDPCQSPLPDAAVQGKIWSDAKEVFFLQ